MAALGIGTLPQTELEVSLALLMVAIFGEDGGRARCCGGRDVVLPLKKSPQIVFSKWAADARDFVQAAVVPDDGEYPRPKDSLLRNWMIHLTVVRELMHL